MNYLSYLNATIIVQKITKMFNRLAIRFIKQKESIISSES